ncbi:hypothetical protein EHI8A_068470 [Entamoeba histolytica HM-1:IMSS-B]|uniref:Uncharacterized protein n=5 Tax=Entamoeba histolytica TaxID=5759 RepID=C4M0R2_ENTH1|nr:hypothetical protein EHI_009980 [Entamoeba histolytica HM-1:IMSS]EMH75721.1 hypothetical protein EHI8A_068470 [Entamoeba histolytica HM-1:IMSS-B]EMS17480.1 hypothetical protein KM1_128600 [Entamoeba histolytica HM-3:IMSS]ENY61778.1 hypothetical protein EHI7A_066880 [Entamoeba histolytica HM-1:IMSS-A]GAT94762.1 hypothetical protein CL6EHI_009980 [Entamoeba histolytica]EAL51690.1 hypothetical protein EHI_009980 [Entamoeba histolytica HM-1:IMSS]|eukprot:XP_657076.1 hypothetical protein EHI_009980 [Entamoeba histolytica HM-1:IMSS]
MNSSYQLIDENDKKNYLPLVISIFSSLFFIISLVLIIVIWGYPITLPDPNQSNEVVNFFKTVQKPVDEVMNNVDTITLSLKRANVFSQILASNVNETILQINNSIQQDYQLVVILSEIIEGLVQFITNMNDSILGFIIDDAFVDEITKLKQQFYLFLPEIKMIQKFLTDINSNFKGFLTVFDFIAYRMGLVQQYTKSLSHIFVSLINGISLSNNKAQFIIKNWIYIKSILTIICFFVSITSLTLAIEGFIHYRSK